MRAALLVLLAAAAGVAPALPAAAQPRRAVHRRAAHAVHGRRATGSVPYPQPWGTSVYGASLPFVNGTCIDPFDPDPIGGPDRVGNGGPGGYGPQCRAQAGVIPGTTLR